MLPSDLIVPISDRFCRKIGHLGEICIQVNFRIVKLHVGWCESTDLVDFPVMRQKLPKCIFCVKNLQKSRKLPGFEAFGLRIECIKILMTTIEKLRNKSPTCYNFELISLQKSTVLLHLEARRAPGWNPLKFSRLIFSRILFWLFRENCKDSRVLLDFAWSLCNL